MALIRCKKHGLQGFSEVCVDIDTEYNQDIYREHRDFCIGELYGILVCEECWNKHNLDRFQTYLKMSFDDFLDLDEEEAKPIEEEWDKVYQTVNRKGWCIQCVAEIRVKQARKKGEPEPFPTYERTLTQLQQEKIDELKASLLTNFKFQNSVDVKIYRQEHSAVFLQAGSFTSPLTIKIYYVFSEKEQSLILDFVNELLSKTESNQAKIMFLESENWIKTEHPSGTISHFKGEEKILKEVYLNC
jgi:hypothetical protein